MLNTSTQDNYRIPAEDHGLESGQPVFRGAQRHPRHYKPLATKSACLLLILGALLICITLLEVVFHQGAHPTSSSNLGKREIRRQDASSTTDGGVAADTTVAATSAAVTTPIPTTQGVSAAETTVAAASTVEPTSNPTSAVTATEIGPELTLTSDPPPASTSDGAALTLTSSDEQDPTGTILGPALTLTSSTESGALSSTLPSTKAGAGLSLTSSPSSTSQEVFATTTSGAELSLTSSRSSTSQGVTATTTSGAELTLTSFALTTVELTLTSSKSRTTMQSTSKPGADLSLTSSKSTTTARSTSKPGAALSSTSSAAASTPDPTGTGTNPGAALSLTSATKSSRLSNSMSTDPTTGSKTTETNPAPLFSTSGVGLLTLTSKATVQTKPKSNTAHTTGASTYTTETVIQGSQLSLTSSTTARNGLESSKSTSASTPITPTITTSASSEMPATITTTIVSSVGFGTQLSLTVARISMSSNALSSTIITELPTTESGVQLTFSSTNSGQASAPPTGTVQQNSEITSFYTTLITTTDSSGQTTSYYLVVEQGKTTSNSGSAYASTTMVGGPEITSELTIKASTSAAATTAPSLSHILSTEIVIKGPFQKVDYVKAMYLGPFIAVALKTAWDVVYSSAKMMEPFYQLAKPGGASAHDSLCADYLSSGLSWNSWELIFGGHWVMALTTAIYITMGSLAPVASESMTVKAGGFCVTPVSKHQPCDPMWVIDVVVSRGLEGLLTLNALMITVLILIASRRRSGVYSNPSSIASMAAILGDPTVIEEFRQIDPQASPETLRMALSENRYMLGQYVTASGTIREGLTKSNKVLNPGNSYGAFDTNYKALPNPANVMAVPERTIPWILILEICFLLSILTMFGLILGYYFDGKSDPLNNFFNSGVFGPRFILTFIATLVDSQWKRLEREVRITEPYRILSKRRAPPQSTVLASMNGTPITSLPIALWRGNFFHAWVSFVAILSDILIIAVAGVPFTEAQIHPALLASCYTSLCILGLMFCTVVALLFWRRSNPRMPRLPETMATVFMYLCGSRMVDDFHDMETIGTRLRDEAVRRSGRKYWFGLALGKGGQERWMVDHEKEGSMVFY